MLLIVNVDIIARVTQDLLLLMTPNEIDSAMDVVKTSNGVNMSQWDEGQIDKDIPKQNFNAFRINKTHAPKFRSANFFNIIRKNWYIFVSFILYFIHKLQDNLI